MSTNALKSQLEALLFVSDEPATVTEFAQIITADEDAIAAALSALRDEYSADERGFQLREVAVGWRLYSNPAHHELIENYVLSWDTRKLSQAALEALAVVAYRQPVSRGGINAIRGVNSEAVIGSLLEKGLIKEVGREKSAGSAILYGTTTSFLEKFGLASLDALPALEEFEPPSEMKDEIRRRLDATLPAEDEHTVEEELDDLDELDEDLEIVE